MDEELSVEVYFVWVKRVVKRCDLRTKSKRGTKRIGIRHQKVCVIYESTKVQ